MRPLPQIAVWQNVDKARFDNEIKPLAQPAVLKGFVSNWPVVKAAAESDECLLDLLKADYKGGEARFLSQSAEEDGYYFYDKAYSGFNFTRKIASLDAIFQLLKARITDSTADRIAMQSAPVNDYFHTLGQLNSLSLYSSSIEPRFWLGTEGKVNTHYDDADNIACVVSGKRVFTLFPPEQIKNLYIGSLENTPGGAAVSLAKLDQPDFQQYPKLQYALNHALQAELEPGDAIYIPALWWHHVEAKSKLNMLINYWQGGSIEGLQHPTGLDAVLVGLVSLAKLPRAQRQGWIAIFHYLVGSDRAEFEYIPEPLKGLLSGDNKESEQKVYQWLQTVLQQSKNK